MLYKTTNKAKRKLSGRILSEESYTKYNKPKGMGGPNMRVSYFKCCNCNKKGTNLSFIEDGIEYGIKAFADMMWCDFHYFEFFEHIQGEL